MFSVVLLVVFTTVTFVGIPAAVYVLAAGLIRPAATDRIRLFLLVTPLAPLVLALVMMWLYMLPIRFSPNAEIFIIIITVTSALYFGRFQLKYLIKDLKEKIFCRPKLSIIDAILIFLIVIVVLQIITLPMMQNDAIEYMAVAKRIFEARTLSVYPVVEAAPNGLFAPPSHPPAYHMYIAWGYAWLGTANFAPARLLALYALAGMAALFAVALWSHRTNTTRLAILLLLTVPLYITVLVGYHIDPLRLLAFFAAAIATAQVIDKPEPRQAVLTGVLLGFAAFAHSIGILAWVFGGLAWIILGPADRFRNFRIPLIIVAVALAVGSPQFVKNMLTFGLPLQDSAPVLEMPEIDFANDLKYRRGLVTPADRTVFGVFRGFFELPLFGLLFWLMLPVLWLIWRTRRSAETLTRVAAIWIGAFFLIAGVTAAMGIDLVIKNARYLMTVVPLIPVLVAPSLAKLWPSGRWARRAFAIGLAFFSIWMLLQSVVRLVNYGARLDIALTGERAPIYRLNSRIPGAPLYRYIEQNLRPGEKTLVFRQADFTLFGTGRWLDNFDTSLMPFYRLTSLEEAHAWLRARNVRFVLVPSYTFPTYYRTIAGQLLNDPRFVTPVNGFRGTRLYRLRDTEAAEFGTCEPGWSNITTLSAWISVLSLELVAGKAFGLPFLATESYARLGELELEGQPANRLKDRYEGSAQGTRWRLLTGEGPIGYAPYEQLYNFPNRPELVRVELDVVGSGFIDIALVEYRKDASGEVNLRISNFWNGVLKPDAPTKIPLLYSLPSSTRAMRISIENTVRADADVRVTSMRMCRWPLDTETPRPQVSKTPIMQWPSNELKANCMGGAGKDCSQSSNAVFRISNGEIIEMLSAGNLMRFSSVGFQPGRWDWRFRVGTLLEALRLRAERSPEGLSARVIRPVLDWVAPSLLGAPLEDYSLTFEAAGSGEFSAYIQFVSTDGRIDWRYAGKFFLSSSSRTVLLDFKLPANAKATDFVLEGSATRVKIGTVQLDRVTAPGSPLPDDPLAMQ